MTGMNTVRIAAAYCRGDLYFPYEAVCGNPRWIGWENTSDIEL